MQVYFILKKYIYPYLDKIYLSQTQLSVQVLGQGIAWLDMELPDSLLEAGGFIGRG